MDELRLHLAETVKDFQKSKLCPKSTLKFAEQLLKQVNEYKKTITQALSEFDSEYKKVQQQRLKVFGIAAEKVVKYVSIWDDGVKQLKEDLEKADGDSAKLSLYDSFRTHYVRGLGTSLPFFSKNAKIKKHSSTWTALASDGGQPKEASKIEGLLELMEDKYFPTLKNDLVDAGIIK